MLQPKSLLGTVVHLVVIWKRQDWGSSAIAMQLKPLNARDIGSRSALQGLGLRWRTLTCAAWCEATLRSRSDSTLGLQIRRYLRSFVCARAFMRNFRPQTQNHTMPRNSNLYQTANWDVVSWEQERISNKVDIMQEQLHAQLPYASWYEM